MQRVFKMKSHNFINIVNQYLTNEQRLLTGNKLFSPTTVRGGQLHKI